MTYVKLDTSILDSSVWIDRTVRDVFITTILMAMPHELKYPTDQLDVRTMKPTGWVVPPGRYGLIEAAGSGIIRNSLVPMAAGYEALKSLGSPDIESRSQEFEGRRLVRINGGYLLLNYFKYREKDHTNLERQRRFQERKKLRLRLMEPNTGEDAQNVMQQLNLASARLRNPIQAAIDSAAQAGGKSKTEIIAQMVKSYQAYLELGEKGLLRYTWAPGKFFTEGHWASSGSWPIDKERMAELRRVI
jgi:hypothetical protein